MKSKLNTKIFIERANLKHNNFYNYSKANYTNSHNLITIICPKHGEFSQKAYQHLNGSGCPKCKFENMRFTQEQFIQKAKLIHDNKYNYSKVNYINSRTKVEIICPIHGSFWQVPSDHLRKRGCKKCINFTNSQFIEKSNQIHNNFYNYSKVKYVNAKTKVIIICPVHGIFEQEAHGHLQGNGCPICAHEKTSNSQKLTTEDFIQKAKLVHGDKYDYSKVEYINSQTKITIICPTHGEFKQVPSEHLRYGSCPKCRSSKGEIKIRQWLLSNNINFNEQHRFENCKNKKPLPFDFYLPDHNLCLEFDGVQHYKPRNSWGGEDTFKQTQQNDQIKTKYCEDNNIILLRIPYWKINNIEKILNKKLLS